MLIKETETLDSTETTWTSLDKLGQLLDKLGQLLDNYRTSLSVK